MLLLAYPPPADNTTPAQNIGGHSVELNWVNGLTLSDATTP